MPPRQTIGVPTLNFRHNVQDRATREALDALARETTRWLQDLAEQVDTTKGLRGTPTYHANVDAKSNRITQLGVPQDDTDAMIKGLALGRPTMSASYWDAQNMPIINLPRDIAPDQPSATLTQEQIRALIAEELAKLENSLASEPYVVATASASLLAERVLTPEALVLTVTDGGANNAITVGVATNGIGDTKLRQSAALSLIGRSANSAGNVADISAVAASDAVLRESGSTIGFGTVATAGIANNAVTDAKLRDSGALSVIGRSANSSGDPADISATAASDAVLRESGSTIGFGTVATAGIADDAVTDAKLRDSAAVSVIGRSANSSGDPADISAGANNRVLGRFGDILVFTGTPDLTSVTTTGAVNIGGDLNHDGSNVGFNGVAPVARSTGWAMSNVTTDKVLDCDATTIDEVADVLATLINYLISRGDLGA